MSDFENIKKILDQPYYDEDESIDYDSIAEFIYCNMGTKYTSKKDEEKINDFFLPNYITTPLSNQRIFTHNNNGLSKFLVFIGKKIKIVIHFWGVEDSYGTRFLGYEQVRLVEKTVITYEEVK